MYRPSQTPHLNLSSVGDELIQGTREGAMKSTRNRGRRPRSDNARPAHSLEKVRAKNTHTLPKSAVHVPCTPKRLSVRLYQRLFPAPFDRVECGDERNSGISLVDKKRKSPQSPTYAALPVSPHKFRLESSSTGSSFPAAYVQVRSLACWFARA